MRFISIDDISYLEYDVLGGLNLFVYCNNNPIMYVDYDGNDWDSFWSAFWKVVGAVTGFVTGGIIGFLVGAIPGIIIGGIIGSIVGIELSTYIETEIYVSNSNVLAENTFNGNDTYSMSKEEALAYIRWLREESRKSEYYRNNWTEGQMLREWQYHKTGYNLFNWQDDNDESTFAHHFKIVDFEEEQNFMSYILRIIGNLLIG